MQFLRQLFLLLLLVFLKFLGLSFSGPTFMSVLHRHQHWLCSCGCHQTVASNTNSSLEGLRNRLIKLVRITKVENGFSLKNPNINPTCMWYSTKCRKNEYEFPGFSCANCQTMNCTVFHFHQVFFKIECIWCLILLQICMECSLLERCLSCLHLDTS